MKPLSWECEGVIVEKRELKTKDGARIFGHALKVATLGATIEINVDELTWKAAGAGEPVRCAGTFDFYNGIPKFKASRVVAVVQANGKGA